MAEAAALARSRELARTNAELQIANGKLEQFAEIITHDLKAPMRALNHMADAVEAALDAKDEAAARRKLGELRQQATRMSAMLSALLQYASSGLPGGAIETVDTAALIGEIVRSLPHDGMEMQIGGVWPRIATFPAPLDLTLRNLIQNSIKHHDRETGHVLIQCADAGPVLEITIEDDGPGIAPEHHESIFMPFRTLAGNGGGHGIGDRPKDGEGRGRRDRGRREPAAGARHDLHHPLAKVALWLERGWRTVAGDTHAPIERVVFLRVGSQDFRNDCQTRNEREDGNRV